MILLPGKKKINNEVIVQDQEARSFLASGKEARHVFGQTWLKVHSQGLKAVEDGLPARAVTVQDFLEVTGAAVFAAKIDGGVAHQVVKPGGFPAQGGSHDLHVARDPKPRIVRSSSGAGHDTETSGQRFQEGFLNFFYIGFFF